VKPADRPPLGIIVEGHGEQAAFPTLVASICGQTGLHVPIVNARGYGGIVRNLEDHLDDLVRTKHPWAVIVCVDLRDPVNDGLFDNCADLRTHVEGVIAGWTATRAGSGLFEPLPEAIRVVIQVQVFETWWLADAESVADLDLFSIDLSECDWQNVDEELDNPSRWLRTRMAHPINLKSPSLAKDVIRGFRPDVARGRSPSFDKFHREVAGAVNEWIAAICAA
jgi:hypothetical protein